MAKVFVLLMVLALVAWTGFMAFGGPFAKLPERFCRPIPGVIAPLTASIASAIDPALDRDVLRWWSDSNDWCKATFYRVVMAETDNFDDREGPAPQGKQTSEPRLKSKPSSVEMPDTDGVLLVRPETKQMLSQHSQAGPTTGVPAIKPEAPEAAQTSKGSDQ